MRQPKYTLAVAILAASLAGCDYQEEPQEVTRDVYKTLDECMLDWNDAALCGQAAQAQAQIEAAQAQAAASGTGGGNGAGFIFMPGAFYGPEYHPSSRVAYSSTGQAIVPKANHAKLRAPVTRPTASFSAGARSAGFKVAARSFGGSARASGGRGVS